MKKIIALLLSVLFILSLVSCTAKQVEPAAEAETEAATAAVTEADKTDAQETDAPAEEADGDSFTYADKSGLWEMTVPAIWNTMGAIIEYDDGARDTYYAKFVHKTAYDNGGGHIFTVATCVDPASFADVTEFPRAEELFRSDSVQVYVIYPSDVQIAVDGEMTDEAFKAQNEEFTTLRDTKEGIFASLKWL